MARRIDMSVLTDKNRLVKDELIPVYRVDDRTVAKLTDPHRVAEAEALRLVRAKTSIPVPEVYAAYTDTKTNRGVILMEYIEGQVLRDSYARSTAPSSVLFDGTYCEDPVFCAELGGFGPYKTEAEFNEGLIRAMNLSQKNTWVDHATRLVRALPKHKIVLTHADFSPRNILIRGDKVVAILDWEMAGFYPAYWEYIKAMYHPDWQSGWIKNGAVEKILRPYHLEHAVLLHMQEIVF
ncbi:uncharacterized protein CIMG_07605 [Coccidioides immitis RS]|uniref:Aminoglycoside phosphotransferase domain-containing protein n=3 Tax=Coccidioides immitis TaxID=5501 RepID=A0A0E1RWC3_COCIM|nr:uncharacterized protein CIMG_07605 [Coccidioides immitis RS]EAS28859.2 hypothetical protein CIMG_07605 [Coccidioides immitis RS]TPX22968.1 hypothetical protein DIZ76_014849 [Coccidioides immitis]